jgi:succinate dehydrogenase / fumarate reductase cytochrome b subunit
LLRSLSDRPERIRIHISCTANNFFAAQREQEFFMSAPGVQPDHSFFWRKLHSLSGIIPVGAYMADHIWENSYSLVGSSNYNEASHALQTVPWRLPLEICIIWLPILYHSLYGFYVWYRGKTNVSAYPWVGNWMFSTQRWTGLIAFLFIGWHVYTERLGSGGLSTYNSVNADLQNVWFFSFFLLGVTACCVHFGVGIWNFLCKWGLAATVRSQRAAGYLGVGVAAVLIFMSVTILVCLRYGWHPLDTYLSK